MPLIHKTSTYVLQGKNKSRKDNLWIDYSDSTDFCNIKDQHTRFKKQFKNLTARIIKRTTINEVIEE